MFEGLGISPANILLPNCDLSKWSVIACDQYTAQEEYWRSVEETVGDACSSLRLILPEVYLNSNDVEDKIINIYHAMAKYIAQDLFTAYPNTMVYVEREVSGGKIRKGLVCKIDLAAYDFHPGSHTMIRATEKTVLERIPPRVHIREHALLELPHVMILIDDSERSVIAPLQQKKDEMDKLYGFDLMKEGGHIDGWRVSDEAMQEIAQNVRYLCAHTDMLYAVGDGNHSLAAAKTIYENDKKNTPENIWGLLHSRWILAEIVSLNDPGLEFLPIHRIVFGVSPEKMLQAFCAYYPDAVEGEGDGHVIRWCYGDRSGVIAVPHPNAELAVETLQNFIDQYVAQNGGTIDYIHDISAVEELSCQADVIGFILPEFPREKLFPYVRKYGALPRKTFSIGHSRDKRYYLESRIIEEG